MKDAQWLDQRMHSRCRVAALQDAEWSHPGCTEQMQSGCIKGCTKQVQCLHQGDAAGAEWLHYRMHSRCRVVALRMQSGCIKGCGVVASKDAQ